MTSKLTRERLQEIAEDGFLKHGESKVLARMALAVMDSEPLAWTDEEELRDVERSGCGYLFTVKPVTPHADERRIILLYRHAQPVPEKYNIGDATMRHIFTPTGMTNVSDMQAVFDRVEAVFVGMEQPAPVVPDDVLDALQKVARIRLDMNDFDGDRRGIADCLGDAEEALIEVVNRRAAMLAAAPQDEAKKDKPHNNFGTGARLTNHRFKV